MTEIKEEVTLKKIRSNVYQTLLKLQRREISTDEAFASNKLASTIINGYAIEKDMIAIAIKAKDAGIAYVDEIKAIEK